MLSKSKCESCGKKIIVAKKDKNKCYDCVMKAQLDKKHKRAGKHKPMGFNRKGGARIPKHHMGKGVQSREDLRYDNGKIPTVQGVKDGRN